MSNQPESVHDTLEQRIAAAEQFIQTTYPTDPDHVNTVAARYSSGDQQETLERDFRSKVRDVQTKGLGHMKTDDYLPLWFMVYKQYEARSSTPLTTDDQLRILMRGELTDMQRETQTLSAMAQSYGFFEEFAALDGYIQRFAKLNELRTGILELQENQKGRGEDI